ncbi:DNA methyltransferase (fragment) [Candidatus Contendobacter odensis Run_B_J11]|uniref:Methyltransferase n=1 Tax=Candidatus Contendobacter odensis Run_B_J11 TaxID=1400861 RepID=A0A7U7J227_9GAMM
MTIMDYTESTSIGETVIGSSPTQCCPRSSDDIVSENFRQAFIVHQSATIKSPLLLNGDAVAVLRALPDGCIDFTMTSPPYWGKREYENGGIGLENDYRDFVKHLATVFAELKRVLKPEGSFWLNLGDSYNGKGLVGVPWRVAFELVDNQGWILRNSVIWNKLKGGMDNSKDRLGNVHENLVTTYPPRHPLF